MGGYLPITVTLGLDPRVHLSGAKALPLDCPVKPGNDEGRDAPRLCEPFLPGVHS